MLDAEHQQIKDVLEENASQENNYNIIPLNQNIIDAMLQIKVALNNGEYICFNGDRYMENSVCENGKRTQWFIPAAKQLKKFFKF